MLNLDSILQPHLPIIKEIVRHADENRMWMDRLHEEANDLNRWFDQDLEAQCTGDCGRHASH